MVQESTMQQERRQNVRVRPASDYDITIEFEEGLVRVRLAVVDLAIGGIGVLVDELFLGLPIGGEIKLKIELPAVEPFDTVAVLRHTTGQTGGRCGFHFRYLSAEQQTDWGRAVSELLERGHSA